MLISYEVLHIALAHLLNGALQVVDEIREHNSKNPIWERYNRWASLHADLSSELIEEIAYLFRASDERGNAIRLVDAQASASADELFEIAVKYLQLSPEDKKISGLSQYITLCKWLEKILQSAERIYTDFIIDGTTKREPLPSIAVMRTLGSYLRQEIKTIDIEHSQDARLDSTIQALFLTSTWETRIYKLAVDGSQKRMGN